MKKYLIFSILVLCSISCISQKGEVGNKSTIKLEGKNINIQDLMDINGYYTDLSEPQYGNYMFFKDGAWVYFHFKTEVSESEKRENLSKNVQSNIKNNQIQWGTYWGVYRIQNDTIIAHLYSKPSFLKAWGLSENRFRIIDRKTIQRIYYRSILKSADDYYRTNSPWIDESPMHFIPADSLPSSDNWLKENKWIWQNESDWKKYMQQIKLKKK